MIFALFSALASLALYGVEPQPQLQASERQAGYRKAKEHPDGDRLRAYRSVAAPKFAHATTTMQRWHSGYCTPATMSGYGGKCASSDRYGTFGATEDHEQCVQRCLQCSQCRYVTWNSWDRDCSWYSKCDLNSLSHRWNNAAWSVQAKVPQQPVPGGAWVDHLNGGYCSEAGACVSKPVRLLCLRPSNTSVVQLASRGVLECERHMKSLGQMLRVSSAPYLVLPGYWGQELVARALTEVQSVMNQCNRSGEGGDTRTFGVDKIRTADGRLASPTARAFASDAFLRGVARHFFNRSKVSALTLASRADPGTNSGGGWHIDNPRRGIKALLYLTDIRDVHDGPFALLRDFVGMRHKRDPAGRRTRYGEEEIIRQVNGSGAKIEPIYAPAGTVVLFDISSVHSGLPVSLGRSQRFVLTNYYENPMPACRPEGIVPPPPGPGGVQKRQARRVRSAKRQGRAAGLAWPKL